MTGHKSRPPCTSLFSLLAESYEYLISFSSLSAPLCMRHANLLHAGGVNPCWQTLQCVCVCVCVCLGGGGRPTYVNDWDRLPRFGALQELY